MNETALAPIVSDGVPARLIGTDPALEFIEHLDNRWRLAKYMVASGMVPQKRAEEVVVVMLKGYELGLPPMMAAANIHVISGRPTLSADLMCALAAQRAGVRWRVVKESAEEVEILFVRPGWDDYPSRFTIQDARDQGLATKDNWKKMPRQMLMARAKSQGARTIAPDVLAGTYSYDEAESFTGPGNGGTTDDLNAALRSHQEPTETVEAGADSIPEAKGASAPETTPGHDEAPVPSADALLQAEARFKDLMDAKHGEWNDENRTAWAKLIIGHEPETVEDFDRLSERLSKANGA